MLSHAVTAIAAAGLLAAVPVADVPAADELPLPGETEAWRALALELLAGHESRYSRYGRSPSKTRALRRIVEDDPRVSALVRSALPARVEVEVVPPHGRTLPARYEQVLERRGARLGLDLHAYGDPPARLHVVVELEESDTSGQAIFRGNNMKSFRLGIVAELLSSDGALIARGVQNRQVLGISPAHALEHSVRYGRDGILELLIEDLVFRAYRDEL